MNDVDFKNQLGYAFVPILYEYDSKHPNVVTNK
jgi:hypothetical protein